MRGRDRIVVNSGELVVGAQISQTIFDSANPTGATHYFGYDGHGSGSLRCTRCGRKRSCKQHAQIFHYDAYGNLINMPAGVSPLASYLYSGESFDARIGQQYLRARWYNSTIGQFNRLDPFFGNLSDPLSLHKYAYVHGDPVQGTDLTGWFTSISIQIALNIRSFLSNLQFDVGMGVIELLEGSSFDNVMASFLLFGILGVFAGPLVDLLAISGAIRKLTELVEGTGALLKFPKLTGKFFGDEAIFVRGVRNGTIPAFKNRQLLLLGDDVVAHVLNLKNSLKIDFVSISKNGKLVLSEAKGIADLAHAVDQLKSVHKHLKSIDGLGREIGRVEVLIHSRNLKRLTSPDGVAGFVVRDNKLYDIVGNLKTVDGMPIRVVFF